MICVPWQEDCETQIQETYEEYPNLEDVMKGSRKEYEDKDGCKGSGSIQEIFKTDEYFQRLMVKAYFQKI